MAKKGTVPFLSPIAMHYVDVIIPALNEQEALPLVLREIPRPPVRRIVVADNGSTDRTAEVARENGAEVVHEPERGYGAACLRALAHLAADPPRNRRFPRWRLQRPPGRTPVARRPDPGRRRRHGDRFPRARPSGTGRAQPQQQVGNAIACPALRLLYGVRYTDLGPFRAIRWETLQELGMQDRNYGWTVEMQIKAAQRGVAYREVPVSYRRRIGVSKVSGTVRGSVGAGAKILWLLGRYAWS